MKLVTRLLPLTAFAPFFALAQTFDGQYFDSILQAINNLIQTAIPIVFALAMLLFFWGVFVYFIYGGGDEEKRETGKKYMLYSIIGLVVLVSVWGIVNIIQTLFGIGGGQTGTIPGIPN